MAAILAKWKLFVPLGVGEEFGSNAKAFCYEIQCKVGGRIVITTFVMYSELLMPIAGNKKNTPPDLELTCADFLWRKV